MARCRLVGIHTHGQVQASWHTYTWPGAGRLAYIHMVRCRPVDIHTHGQVQASWHTYTWLGAGRLTYIHMARCRTGTIPFTLSLADYYTYSIKIFLHISVASDVCVCYFLNMSSFKCYTRKLWQSKLQVRCHTGMYIHAVVYREPSWYSTTYFHILHLHFFISLII
jgi:hypothetical protein